MLLAPSDPKLPDQGRNLVSKSNERFGPIKGPIWMGSLTRSSRPCYSALPDAAVIENHSRGFRCTKLKLSVLQITHRSVGQQTRSRARFIPVSMCDCLLNDTDPSTGSNADNPIF